VTKTSLAVVIYSIATVGSVTGNAQTQLDALASLLSARSIQCEQAKGTQADWDNGSLKLTQVNWEGRSGPDTTLTFDSIDTQSGTARLISSGAADVAVLTGPSGVTFIEQTDAGNMNFTTIFPYSQPPRSETFIFVRSRHFFIRGPFPSQYHGTCRILQ